MSKKSTSLIQNASITNKLRQLSYESLKINTLTCKEDVYDSNAKHPSVITITPSKRKQRHRREHRHNSKGHQGLTGNEPTWKTLL